ncbi:hypothetical protein Tco_0003150, partial [Tanacetum coccineum]
MLRKQHKVDASHYDMPLIYYTEGHSLHFGRPEFALITGLPFGHVLARERKNEYELLQFKDEFSRLGCEFMNSLNILFEELKELRLCLEAEERMRLEHEKNIIEQPRFMVKEAKRMNILGKLTHTKGNHVDIMPGKTKATVSWVKINKHRLNVNDPSLAELLKKVKPWVEDLSRSFHSLDTIWLTPDIQRFISREGNIKCKFPWSDDYIVGWNFWRTLVCLDPTRKGCLSEEERLPGILGETKVFEKKGIDPTDYSIRFKLADPIPKQGGIFGDCGVWGFVDRNMTDDMAVLDEVVFKIHKNGYFELDPLSIPENIWALFYCLPNTPLENGLKLIHTDNDVHSFFAYAERREEDASLRCSSSSPFSTRIKRKSHKTTKDFGTANSRVKEKMVDDEPLGRKLLKNSRTGKEKMVREVDDEEVEEPLLMVEVGDVGLIEAELNLLNKKDFGKKPVGSTTDVQESNVK